MDLALVAPPVVSDLPGRDDAADPAKGAEGGGVGQGLAAPRSRRRLRAAQLLCAVPVLVFAGVTIDLEPAADGRAPIHAGRASAPRARRGLSPAACVAQVLGHDAVGDSSYDESGKGGDSFVQLFRDHHLKVHRNTQAQLGGDVQLQVGGIDGAGRVDVHVRGDRLELVEGDRHEHVVKSTLEKVDGSVSRVRIPVDLGIRSARDLGGRSGPLGRIGAERRVECVRGGRCGGGLMNRWVMEFSGWRWA